MSVPAVHRAALRALPLFLAAGLASVAWAVESASKTPATAAEKTPAAEKPAADPLELGRGLRYFRFGAGDDAAFATAKNAPALVVDLRLAGEDIANVARLRELLATRDATRPLFVLLGADTPTALRAAISTAPGVLTLAGKDSGVAASVVIAVEPVSDRAAAEALAAGRTPRELVEEKIEKTRFDEARLARNHANGHRDSDTTEAPKDVKSTHSVQLRYGEGCQTGRPCGATGAAARPVAAARGLPASRPACTWPHSRAHLSPCPRPASSSSSARPTSAAAPWARSCSSTLSPPSPSRCVR